MRRLLTFLPVLLSAAAPLSAQTWLDHPPVFEVRLANDTSWHRATQVAVGECPAFTLESDREADGSFTARRFAAATAIRYTDRGGVVRIVPDSDRVALGTCGTPGPTPPRTPPECGRAPDSALAMVNATIARRSTGGSAWAITLGVTANDVKPMTDPLACRRITDAIALTASADTLSLMSVIRIGPAAFAVVRGVPMGSGAAHGAMAFYLLNPSLEVVSNQHFSY